jgi:hypothetical protein
LRGCGAAGVARRHCGLRLGCLGLGETGGEEHGGRYDHGGTGEEYAEVMEMIRDSPHVFVLDELDRKTGEWRQVDDAAGASAACEGAGAGVGSLNSMSIESRRTTMRVT